MPDARPVVRRAEAADHEAIVALEVEAFGPADEPIVRSRLASDPDGWLVAEDPTDGAVVSASVLLHHVLGFGSVTVPVGQIENVATRSDHQRRGLVRAQFDEHHRRSALAGDLAIVITGIPYLYRRFGYGYGLDYPPIRLSDAGLIESWPAAGDVVVRPARVDDVDALVRLDALRSTDRWRVNRTRDGWARTVTRCAGTRYEQLVVAERRGQAVGFAPIEARPHAHRLYLQPGVSTDADVARALIASAVEQAGAHDELVVAWDEPGTAWSAVLTTSGPEVRHHHGIYVRVPDPIALIDGLRPLLSARLAGSRFADRSGEVSISQYEAGLTLAYEAGEIIDVRPCPPIEDPFDTDAIGVPPDQTGALVFGRFGAAALEERVDDVTFGSHRGLMEVLFPRVEADVVADL